MSFQKANSIYQLFDLSNYESLQGKLISSQSVKRKLEPIEFKHEPTDVELEVKQEPTVNLTYPRKFNTRLELNAVFDSYEEFLDEFDSYKQATFQVYSIVNKTKKQDKSGFAYVVFKCKQSKNHLTNRCNAQIRVNNIRKDRQYTEKFKITKFEVGHNHELEEDLYFQHDPHNRIQQRTDRIVTPNLLSITVSVAEANTTNTEVTPVDQQNIETHTRIQERTVRNVTPNLLSLTVPVAEAHTKNTAVTPVDLQNINQRLRYLKVFLSYISLKPN
jgi:hypothetical protein